MQEPSTSFLRRADPVRVRCVPIFLLLALLALMFPTLSAAGILDLQATEHTLENGLRILIVERHDAPTFSAHIRVGVGSAHDPAGQTGIAHFLEHLLFKGTQMFGSAATGGEEDLLSRIDEAHAALEGEQTLPSSPNRIAPLARDLAQLEARARATIIPNELWETYRRNGGTGLNAVTFRDSTQFFVSLPKNRLELWALLESDRLQHPVLREFFTERSVVQEEYRQSVEANARGLLGTTVLNVAFTSVPYGHPVWGWPGDLAHVTRAQALAHFRRHYAPNNTTIVLVGDLDPALTITTIERYFGGWPRQPVPPPARLAEPVQHGERRVTVHFPAQPLLLMAYQAPAADHPDALALTALGNLLGKGETSRLQRRLVQDRRLATGVTVDTSWFMQHAGVFPVQAFPRTPDGLSKLEGAIQAEIDAVATIPPTPVELDRIRNQVEVETINMFLSQSSLAAQLAKAWAVQGDWRALARDRLRLSEVSAESVQDVARRYLRPDRRTTGWLMTRTAGPDLPPEQRSLR